MKDSTAEAFVNSLEETPKYWTPFIASWRKYGHVYCGNLRRDDKRNYIVILYEDDDEFYRNCVDNESEAFKDIEWAIQNWELLLMHTKM